MLGEPVSAGNPEEGKKRQFPEASSSGAVDKLADAASDRRMPGTVGRQLRPGESIVLMTTVYRFRARGRSGLIVQALDEIIDDRKPVPSLSQIGAQAGTEKTTVNGVIALGGYQPQLEELRREWRETSRLFPETEEVAWFLGMLFGASGSVETNPVSLTFTSDNERKLRAFRLAGESILGEAKPEIQGHVGRVRSNPNPSVRFHSKDHVDAIGDFHREKKPDTVLQKHEWVTREPYLSSFVSGFFDSGGSIILNDLKRHITFYTSIRNVAEFYQSLLFMLGVPNSILLETGPEDNKKVMGVRIGRLEEVRTFAQKVSSIDPDIQAQLDQIKETTTRERRPSKPASAVAIVEEWRRLTEDVFGHTPSSSEIITLRNLGEPTFAPGVYIKYFGESDDGGPNKFLPARRRLAHLVTLPSVEMAEEVSSIPVSIDYRKFTDGQVLTEYSRVRGLLGHRPTIAEFRILSPIDIKQVTRYVGEVDGQAPFASEYERRIEARGEQVFP